MDKAYWESYYAHVSFKSNPSDFAQFLFNEYSLKGSIIELGCGNGRDSIFFSSKGLEVIGVDQCTYSIHKLNELYNPKINFIVDDFTNLNNDIKAINIYSRFTFHSIDMESAQRTIKWAAKTIQGGYFAIEVRSVKDDLYGEGEKIGKDTWFTDHTRRFVRLNEIINDLKSVGFRILFSKESKGLAIYKDEDPVIIRIIAQL